MKTIWKWPLPGVGNPSLQLPEGAKILTVQPQGPFMAFVWACVDPDAPLVSRVFATYGTGCAMPDDPGIYISTYQDGDFVWHVYEVTP